MSSSLQSECGPQVEVTSEKVGVSAEKVPCNDFKPNKLNKNKKSPKELEKLIKKSDEQSLTNTSFGCEVSQNSLKEIPWKTVLKSKQGNRKRKCPKYKLETLKKFETINPFRSLENIPEKSDLIKSNTQSLRNTSLGSEVFQQSHVEIPWKTVLKSKQGKRKSKCPKCMLQTWKQLETENPFDLLENISEESADNVMKRLQEIRCIQTIKKAALKKCHSCNYKKRLCMLDRSSCSAVDKICFFCKKNGHFPKSLNCKKFREIKSSKRKNFSLHLSSQETHVKSKDEEKKKNTNLKEKFKNLKCSFIKCFVCVLENKSWTKTGS